MADKQKLADRSFLGSGWSFPPTFSKTTHQVILKSDEEDIKESLEILLSTTIGERFLHPLYGCDLESYVFEAFSATVSTEIKLTVKNAIELFEPRLKLNAVSLDTRSISEGRVDIVIDYEIISTNTRFNMVYPFYLNESAK